MWWWGPYPMWVHLDPILRPVYSYTSSSYLWETFKRPFSVQGRRIGLLRECGGSLFTKDGHGVGVCGGVSIPWLWGTQTLEDPVKARVEWEAKVSKPVLIGQSLGSRAKTLRDQGTTIRLIDNIQDRNNLGNCLANHCCRKPAVLCWLLGRGWVGQLI